MSAPPPRGLSSDEERRLRNLRLVAEHLAKLQAEAGSRGARQPAAQADQVAQPQPPSRAAALLKSWGPVGLVLLFILGKAKWLLALFKFAKLGTLASMVVSVWAYSMLWGWVFALGFVLLIFVHEAGHAAVMRREKIPAGAPVFIPFVGAVIAMRGRPRDAWVEAKVGIGGPLLGTVGAAVCLVLALFTGAQLWWAFAYTGFMLNLFNMIPISPLDGGRIVGALSRWLWVVGYVIGGVVFWHTRSPLLFLILLLGLFGLPRLMRSQDEAYYAIPPSRRVAMGAAYFGLLAALALGMWYAETPLSSVIGPDKAEIAAAALLATLGAALRERQED